MEKDNRVGKNVMRLNYDDDGIDIIMIFAYTILGIHNVNLRIMNRNTLPVAIHCV